MFAFIKMIGVTLIIFILSFFCLEGVIRFCLFTNYCSIKGFNKSGDFFSKDDERVWLLEYRIADRYLKTTDSPQSTDPLLGWDLKSNFDNGCVVTNDIGAQEISTEFDSSNQQLFFYGDSAVAGLTCSNGSVAAFLEQETKLNTINFGVIGYGLDQTLLKVNKTSDQINANDIVLVGLVLDDLNRSLLRATDAQKPYFIFDGVDQFKLQGPPIPEDPNEYFKSHPVKVKSYFFNKLYYHSLIYPWLIEFGLANNVPQDFFKINEFIIDRIIESVNERQAKLYVVIFYSQHQLDQPFDYRHDFLIKKLDQEKITYFDTYNYINDHAFKNATSSRSIYLENDLFHHNSLGNEVVAKYLTLDLAQHLE